MKDQILQHENRITEAETQIADVKKALRNFKVGDGAASAGVQSSAV